MRQDVVVASEGVSVSNELISHILDYVKPSHRCVLSAFVEGFRIRTQVRFESPGYTLRPVEYLNSSALAVSLAQAAQVLMDITVRGDYYPFSSSMSLQHLEYLRQNHELYFVDLDMKFRRRHPPCDYEIMLELINSRRVGKLAVHSVRFGVGDSVKGTFRTVVPLIGYIRE